MSLPKDHGDCAAFVKYGLGLLGAEVTVSTLAPLVDSVYEDLGLTCPHGMRFYAEPTSEQIAAWAEAGVE